MIRQLLPEGHEGQEFRAPSGMVYMFNRDETGHVYTACPAEGGPYHLTIADLRAFVAHLDALDGCPACKQVESVAMSSGATSASCGKCGREFPMQGARP